MNLILIIILIVILVVYYFYNNSSEKFRLLYDVSPQSIGYGNYKPIGYNPWKQQYIMPPDSTEPNVDYQDYLNEISGYDGASRSYNNPYYAQAIAAGLDTY
jgi:hypothetical protein